jgi:hypothetical protein
LEILQRAREVAVERSDLWWLPEVLRQMAAIEGGVAGEQLLEEAEKLARTQGSLRLAESAAADLAAVRTN